MSSEIAIRVVNVHKHYAIYAKPEDRLKQMILPRIKGAMGLAPSQHFTDFAAVNGVSFEVRRGETVGIVGRNGSGKSTLLQMVCGTLQSTSGSVHVQGRIAALLELGSGFNPEFTGRENVFLNAAILGLSQRETENRFDAIAAFADIGAFIEQPVRTYSSGMYVRLAFAVAIHVDPDILIVDEALAVGDEAFQRKCFARIENIRKNGSTILFVSHGSQTVVQLCDRAILLDRGEKILEGSPKLVIQYYHRMLNLTGESAEVVRNQIKAMPQSNGDPLFETGEPKHEEPSEPSVHGLEAWFDPGLISSSLVEYESIGAKISNVHIVDEEERGVNCLPPNGKFKLVYDVHFERDFERVAFAMFVKTISGLEIGGRHSHPSGQGMTVFAGQTVRVSLPFDCAFLPAVYACNCGVFLNLGSYREILHRLLDAILFRVTPPSAAGDRYGIIDVCPDDEPAEVTTISNPDSLLRSIA